MSCVEELADSEDIEGAVCIQYKEQRELILKNNICRNIFLLFCSTSDIYRKYHKTETKFTRL